MDCHTFLGKRKIGSTDICDFTDYQGIGRDPLYKRYEGVMSIVNRVIDPKYTHFLAAPHYSIEEDLINWYIDDWKELPEPYVSLEDDKKIEYQKIKDATIAHYRKIIGNLSGEEFQVLAGALRYIEDDFIYCCDGKVYLVAWGMTPDTRKHIIKGVLVHESPCLVKHKINFEIGEHGVFASKLGATITLPEGEEISINDLPQVVANEGYDFKGWDPNPIGTKVLSDLSFKAIYSKRTVVPPPPRIPDPPQKAICRFNAGSNGRVDGNTEVVKMVGSRIISSDIPTVVPVKGFVFKGWDMNPLDAFVKGDMVFNAIYEQKLPWYKRLWLLLTGKGCLKWLLWFLLALLLLFLLSWFLHGCHGCTREENGVEVSEKIVGIAGDTIDDNGTVRPIRMDNGHLPDNPAIVAPIRNEDGSLPPIEREPGVPPVVANRLLLFLENESDNIDALAEDFKKAYPGDQYSIIGYDREVKSLLIQIPEGERDEIRRTINSRIPNHKFIVFDEELYELNGHLSSSSSSTPGWHLNAIKTQEGWQVTKGSPSVVVAVVDDGIDSSHPIFKDKIVDAYNVFTQNNKLSNGEGHGTHTAGLAVGSQQFLSQGAAGVAPECKLMPVQVIDNGMCPLSALVSGIMYSVHKGADVVNISIGPSFQGLNQLPIEMQNEIAQTKFKNVEMLWNRVCKLAAQKNTILVFAAGNDDIISSIPPENRSSVAITVGAVDQKLYPTDFTNYGPCTDISAPGKEIYSSFPVKDFRSCDGTSMAAPIVSGTIALMKSLKKDLTVKQAYNVLYKTGKEVYGNMPPMVQVNLALDAVKRGDFSDPPQRNVRPVPDAETMVEPGSVPPSSWTDVGGIISEGEDQSSVVVIADQQDPGRRNDIPGRVEPTPNGGNETDYEAIRRMIAKYKQKIAELEGQLPENKR